MDESVLLFICEYFDANGWAPAYREICDAVGVRSTSTVMKSIYSLDRSGMIRFGSGPRKIAVTDAGRERVGEMRHGG